MSGLVVHDLTVQVHGRTVVDRVSFAVEPGERLCLLGASGSGKSLTARAVVGQSLPGMTLSGQVLVEGHDVAGRPASRRPADARVAMVFQDSASALHPLISVGAQIGTTLRRHGAPAAELTVRVDELLASVGLDTPGMAARVPCQLSGGQRQRACIALALASRPTVLIADEPTTALDAVAQATVLEVLREQVDTGTALVFITHDLAVATSLCDRAVVLADGRVVEEGRLPDLLWEGQHPYTRELSAAAYAQSLPTNPDSALADPYDLDHPVATGSAA